MFFPKFTGKDGKSKIENIAKLNKYIFSYICYGQNPKFGQFANCLCIFAIFGTFLCDICKNEDKREESVDLHKSMERASNHYKSFVILLFCVVL